MRLEKHSESLREVLDEIRTALEDPEGLSKHQRRLAMMLSLGITEVVEMYFHKLDIMKSGARIKHDWFRKRDLWERLQKQITGNLEEVENIEEILDLSREIEEDRNDMAYGSPTPEEDLIKNKINQFLEVKSLVEEKTGDLLE